MNRPPDLLEDRVCDLNIWLGYSRLGHFNGCERFGYLRGDVGQGTHYPGPLTSVASPSFATVEYLLELFPRPARRNAD